jgi:hypothetical protein
MLKQLIPFVLLLTSACAPAPSVPAKNAGNGHPGDALRARLGITLPHSDSMVIVRGVAQHHTKFEWSVVAWRSRTGTWTVERAGEESSGLLKLGPQAIPSTKKILTVSEAAQLERLIKDRDVLKEVVVKTGQLSVGGYQSMMEIITPRGKRTVSWVGRLTGKLGAIADVVIGAN